jgi:hypothetical protein
VISAPASRMLPWVFPLPGHFRENLERDSARSPLTRFAESLPKEQPGRRPRVSIGSRFTPFAPAGRPANAIEVTLLGFPHLSAPEHSEPGSLGLWVHLLPCRTSLPTSRQSLKDPTPCRSCPGSAQVPSLRDGARGVLQSFRVHRSRRGRYRRRIVLLRGWRLVQSLSSAEVSPVLVRRSRFAVGRCLGYAVFPRRTSVINV